LERDRAGLNPARGLIEKNSNESRTASTQDESNHEVVPESVEVAMEEDDINPAMDVEELPTSFFHASRSFPEDDNAASLDQQNLAVDSMTKRLPGNNTQPGSSGADERQRLPSSSITRALQIWFSPLLYEAGSKALQKQEERLWEQQKEGLQR
jgi:hypothetical protein